mgnify:CR=1 FL=1
MTEEKTKQKVTVCLVTESDVIFLFQITLQCWKGKNTVSQTDTQIASATASSSALAAAAAFKNL